MNDLLTGRRLTFWTALKLLWHLPTLVQLLVRLLGDASIAVGAKTLFAGMILFILSPFDVPNFVPVLGQVSDVVLALLASRWFLSACPAETVADHLGAIRGRVAVPSEDPAARFIGLRR
jgi:uncharacterized membrane protein YkvA (DUF1232 family)